MRWRRDECKVNGTGIVISAFFASDRLSAQRSVQEGMANFLRRGGDQVDVRERSWPRERNRQIRIWAKSPRRTLPTKCFLPSDILSILTNSLRFMLGVSNAEIFFIMTAFRVSSTLSRDLSHPRRDCKFESRINVYDLVYWD